MKIGFITTSLTSGHASRGVGFYTKELLGHLQPLAKTTGDEIVEITDPAAIPAVDLIHYPYFDPFFPSLPLHHPAPVVVTIHDLIPLEFPDRYPPGLRGTASLWRQRLALGQARAVITDSYASVKAIRRYLHVPHEKIKLIYLAPGPQFKPITDKKFLKTISAKYHLPPRFVLYLGDVNWNKNLYGLLAAVKQSDIPLVLVGKQSAALDSMNFNHPELGHLRAVLELINRKDSQVYRLGFVPDADLVGIFNLATVYCQASFAEGFGLPVTQAMACGLPVACSRTHSLPEIAADAAVYFDPKDINSISWALNRLLSNPQIAAKYSRAGLLQAKRFSWDYTARSTFSVYREVLGK